MTSHNINFIGAPYYNYVALYQNRNAAFIWSADVSLFSPNKWKPYLCNLFKKAVTLCHCIINKYIKWVIVTYWPTFNWFLIIINHINVNGFLTQFLVPGLGKQCRPTSDCSCLPFCLHLLVALLYCSNFTIIIFMYLLCIWRHLASPHTSFCSSRPHCSDDTGYLYSASPRRCTACPACYIRPRSYPY